MPGSGAQHRSVPGHGLNASHAGGVEQSSASGSTSLAVSFPPPLSVDDPVSPIVVSLDELSPPPVSVDAVSVDAVSVDDPVSVLAVSPLVEVSDAIVSPLPPESPEEEVPSSLLEHAASAVAAAARNKKGKRCMVEASLNGFRAGRQHTIATRDAGQMRVGGFS
jgi:hypothetical protein